MYNPANMMNPYLFFILAILILQYLLDLVVDVLEIRSLDPLLPRAFRDFYDEEKYAESQKYTRVTTRFSQIRASISLVLTVAFILIGGFNLIDLIARNFDQGTIITGLLFTGMVYLLSLILSLPFSIYFTFEIEESFGFNKTTVKTFVLDLVKGLLLTIVIGVPL